MTSLQRIALRAAWLESLVFSFYEGSALMGAVFLRPNIHTGELALVGMAKVTTLILILALVHSVVQWWFDASAPTPKTVRWAITDITTSLLPLGTFVVCAVSNVYGLAHSRPWWVWDAIVIGTIVALAVWKDLTVLKHYWIKSKPPVPPAH